MVSKKKYQFKFTFYITFTSRFQKVGCYKIEMTYFFINKIFDKKIQRK